MGVLLPKSLAVTVTICILLGTTAPALAAAPSPLLPLDHWAYAALDRLSGRGLIDSYLSGSRPLTRAEAARLVGEATGAAAQSIPSSADQRQLQLLSAEFAFELAAKGTETPLYLKPFRALGLRYAVRDGSPSQVTGLTATRQWSLDVNNFGEELNDSENLVLTTSGDARLGWLLFEWRPRFEPIDGDDTFLDSSLPEGRAALQLGAIEVSAGRQALWWGQGRHGSLLLTNNARPLEMLRLTNPQPALLPWIFSALGPIRFDLFWSRLEKARVVPEPYLAGLRLNLKPLPWFEFGAARTVMFGGKGRPKLDSEDFITILGGKNLSGGADTSNSLAAIDGRLRLPFLFGAELYGEFGGEDEASHFFSKPAWLAGLSLTRLEPSGSLLLRAERADFTAHSTWYRHSVYRSGYTYRGKLLGHHVGGGGDDLLVAAELRLPANLELVLAWDAENRGIDQPVREEHRQWSLSGVWRAGSHYSLHAFYAWDEIENRSFVAGRTDRQHRAEVAFEASW